MIKRDVSNESVALELPHFANTEAAVRFGLTITRDQFIVLFAARAAMREIFDELRTCYGESAANMQLRADLATRMQLYREAMDVAPTNVLASLIGCGIADEEDLNGRFALRSEPVREFLEVAR